jgi:hypothetical protein
MFANSYSFKSFLSLTTYHLLNFNLSEFSKFLAATFHNVRLFL